MTAAAEDEARDRAGRLGLQPGLTVQELGYDDDVDDQLRAGVEDIVGGELVDEDFDDVVDVVLMWWREDDGDLVDGLARRHRTAGRPRCRLAHDPQARAIRSHRGRGHRRRRPHGGAAADQHHQRRRRTGRALDWWPPARSASVGLNRRPEPGAHACQSRSARPPPSSPSPTSTAQQVSLSDYRGEKNVVLMFYPAGVHRNLHQRAVHPPRPIPRSSTTTTPSSLGVSCDRVPSLKMFAEQEGIDVPAAERLLAARRGVPRLRRVPGEPRHLDPRRPS